MSSEQDLPSDSHPHPDGNSPYQASYSPFIPLILIVTTLLVGQISLLLAQIGEQQLLVKAKQAQQTTLQQAQALREQFQGLVNGTKQLADSGHPAAQQVVEELERSGITFQSKAIPEE